MSRPFCLVDTTFLEKAMDAASLRGQVIASNITNANTPGYESMRVEFESDLSQAMEDDAKGDPRAKKSLKPPFDSSWIYGFQETAIFLAFAS